MATGLGASLQAAPGPIRAQPASLPPVELRDNLHTWARLTPQLDGRLTHVPNECQHNLVAEWQTWMKMHGSPGHILFVGHGTHFHDPERVPTLLQGLIDSKFPSTLEATRKW